MTPPSHHGGSLHVTRIVETDLPTWAGPFRAIGYADQAGVEHVALVHGAPRAGALARVHSECLTGDAFGSLRCDCGPQLRAAMTWMVAEGAGVVVYLLGHEGRGIGLVNKLRAYALQDARGSTRRHLPFLCRMSDGPLSGPTDVLKPLCGDGRTGAIGWVPCDGRSHRRPHPGDRAMKTTAMKTTQRPSMTRDERLWLLVGFLIGLATWLGTDNVAAGIAVAMALGLGLSAYERSSRSGDRGAQPPDVRRATRT